MRLTIARATCTDRLVAACLNTLYSYYWDVIYDWDLANKETHYPLLRRHLVYEVRSTASAYDARSRRERRQNPLAYYAALLFNFLLRFSWSMKLSPHVNLDPDLKYAASHPLFLIGD